MHFSSIKTAISTQFARMQPYPLFRTSVSRDELWDTYLSSFPAGTNPLYRERTEHDCSCCRAFIRAIEDVVAVIDGQPVSLWSMGEIPDSPAYTTVCATLALLVLSHPIISPFLHHEPVAGTDRTFEQITGIEAGTIIERYSAVPFCFRFSTRSREEDELDSRETAHSPMYYLGGQITTIEEVRQRADPSERILLSNMECNGYDRVVVNTNSWKWTAPLEPGDVVLSWTWNLNLS
jgi:hypothetical protein